MKTLTEVYKDGMNDFAKIATLTEDTIEQGDQDPVDGSFYNIYRGQFNEWIKQNTLTLLQSEHDRLEGEKKTEEDMEMSITETDIDRRNMQVSLIALEATGYEKAITDQQTYLLKTINEIKSL